jgi:hypothetical protein
MAEHTKESFKPPSLALMMGEGRAFFELGTLYLVMPLLRRVSRGDGHPVLVFPGFMASDTSTGPLRRFLRDCGYAVHGWKLGRNLGPTPKLEHEMRWRLKELWFGYGQKVSLIGWSLGGIYARELARAFPQDVRLVITLGSPFNKNPKANHAWRLFEFTSGLKIDHMDPVALEQRCEPPPVPTTAIYSRTDGITAWQCCVEKEGPLSENIEVEGSHCGLGYNPLALYAIADRLAQPEGQWCPFERTGLKRFLYPDPQRDDRFNA